MFHAFWFFFFACLTLHVLLYETFSNLGKPSKDKENVKLTNFKRERHHSYTDTSNEIISNNNISEGKAPGHNFDRNKCIKTKVLIWYTYTESQQRVMFKAILPVTFTKKSKIYIFIPDVSTKNLVWWYFYHQSLLYNVDIGVQTPKFIRFLGTQINNPLLLAVSMLCKRRRTWAHSVSYDSYPAVCTLDINKVWKLVEF